MGTTIVAPGTHWLRFYTNEGSSGLRPFVVGTAGEVAEVEPNDALAFSTAFNLTQGPIGFSTSYGAGAIGSTSDADYWRFTGIHGDRVSVAPAKVLDALTAAVGEASEWCGRVRAV